MKHYILAIVVLCSLSLAAPAMAAANLTATQTSYTEMWVNGTGFTSGATVTLSTSTTIPVTPSSGDYSYEITGMYLPAGSVLALDASPVNDDLKLYVKKNWLLKKTFENGSVGISYNYNDATDTVHVGCSSIPSLVAGTFQTIKVYGTTANSSVNMSVTVRQDVTTDGSGSFSEKVDISAIPAGGYMIRAVDDDTPPNTSTTNTTIYAPGQLHHIEITDPQTSEMTLNTTESYTFGATGYDLENVVVQNVPFIWWSSSTCIGTIDYAGDFEADHAGHTEVYAKSGTKESNHVIVYVNAPTETGSGNATSGNSTVDVALNDTLVSGTVNITEIGDPVNSNLSDAGGNDTNLGLGTGAGENQLIKGAVVNVNESIHDALDADAVNGTSWVHIRMEYDQSVIDSLGIVESTLDIWKYNDTTNVWELVNHRLYCLESGRDMIADYLWVNVTHLCSYALVGTTKSSSSRGGGGGGGDGTYPPGWFGTPTPTPAVTPTSTPSSGVTPAPAGWRVTPTPAKPAGAGATPTAPAGEEPTKKGIPGFTAAFAIAGLLAIAYVMVRRRR